MTDDDVREEHRFYSVTTLMGEGMGKGDALLGWVAKTCSEFAVRNLSVLQQLVANGEEDAAIRMVKDARWSKSGKAAARGTEVHAVAEQLALGQEPVIPENVAPWVEQYTRFLSEQQPTFLAAEASVFNPTYRYAGTLDFILKLGDQGPFVMDVKTTDKRPDEQNRPPWPETALQLCAYQRAEWMAIGPATQRTYNGRRYYIWDERATYEPMPQTVGALVLVVSPSDYQLVPMRTDDEVWHTFLHVREVARWRLDISRRVTGPAITRGAK